jgi:hypothetical protein
MTADNSVPDTKAMEIANSSFLTLWFEVVGH